MYCLEYRGLRLNGFYITALTSNVLVSEVVQLSRNIWISFESETEANESLQSYIKAVEEARAEFINVGFPKYKELLLLKA